MTRRKPATILEDVASAVVLADPTDTASLQALGALIDELDAVIAEEPRPGWQGVVDDWSARLDAVRKSRGAEAKKKKLTGLAGAITEFQSQLREHAEPDNDNASGHNSAAKPEVPPRNGQFVVPPWVEQDILDDFLTNQEHVLQALESDLLGIEAGSGDPGSLRGRIHNLKGEAGVLGMDDLEKVCHALEDFVDGVKPLRRHVDFLLTIRDWITKAVARYADSRLPEPPGQVIATRLRAAMRAAQARPPAEDSQPPQTRQPQVAQREEPAATEGEPPVTTIARDDETLELFSEFLEESGEGLDRVDQILLHVEQDGADAESINSLFRVFHTIKGVAGFLDLRAVSDLAHATETMLNQAREGLLLLQGAALDLVFDSTELMRRLVEEVRRAISSNEQPQAVDDLAEVLDRLQAAIEGIPPDQEELPAVTPGERIGDILSRGPDPLTPETIDAALAAQRETGRLLGEELVARHAVPAKRVAHALRAQSRTSPTGPETRIRETVKVDVERIDSLVEMIGELVIAESMVAHAPEIVALGSPRVQAYLNHLGRITRDLQDVGMRMRMVPLRGLFQKMGRMVRDLSRKAGKQVRLELAGEATEIDRSIVEQLADPLMHMVRNAVSHGLESTRERIAAGKPPVGVVRLAAHPEGGSIVIEVEDDGRGLYRDKLLARGIQLGLVDANSKLTDTEVHNLIFTPGFSTAAEVTEVSGRGVGMDVVKKNINTIRGRTAILTHPGQGTCFRIILPLTLAIIDGMLVSCGSERYIIPTLSIVESIQLKPAMRATFGGRGELVSIRETTLPLLRLSRLLEIGDATDNSLDGLVVVVEGVGRRVALLVDEVITQHQVVIKSLGRGLAQTPFISGAAIMSDGRVGLILNVEEICAHLEQGAGDGAAAAEAASAATPRARRQGPTGHEALHELKPDQHKEEAG